ncbi:hypothetical protein [Desulfosporosinus acidiphilus]|uniref:hypothetical protein n=1 Tax=Desulfosporosinus acidiphilus TaxID=885581 RepID=UPI000257A9A7|nr:hypothetical protein [Desulfosporosinus acidiphilus]
MKRKVEIGVFILLPLLILGLLVLNARIMNAHYMTLNGFDQKSKIYSEKFSLNRKTLNCKPGQTITEKVVVTNTSNFIWPYDGSNPVHMSYHVLNTDKYSIIDDGLRSSLPKDLLPGQKVTLSLIVKAPNQQGQYIVQLDMVQEGVSWFKDKSKDIPLINLDVQ